MPAPGGTSTPLFRLYRGATRVLAPLAYRSVAAKLRKQGVTEDRIGERYGHATVARPSGRVIWFHAASVGESLSVLTLITRMGERLPQTSFLITSGTATSAELIARRLPPRTSHQFAPLDAPGPVGRFYDHWSPQAGVFVESELWPLTLTEGQRRGIPLALLNARLSDKSVRGWQKWPDTARRILDVFAIMLTQNRKSADNLVAMGGDPDRIRPGANLKSTSAPLPVDHDTLATIQQALGKRAVWIASSTHPGEEETVLAAHQLLLQSTPDLCLVLIPRHPERGDEVSNLVTATGFTMARRTANAPLTDTTQVYLADTLGETGTWYALSPLVFLGGSLLPIGGHNPFEPAQAGGAILTGPHVFNFSETFEPLIAAGGAIEVTDAPSLARNVKKWLDHPAELATARQAASRFASSQQTALAGVIDTLCDALDLDAPDA